MNLFLINLIPPIGFLISLTVYHQKTKEKILMRSIICNIISIIHYLLLSGYSAVFVKVIAIFRDNLMILKDKNRVLNNKLILFLLLSIYIVIAITTYNGLLSIFSVIPAFIYTIAVWQNSLDKIKKVAFLSFIFWIIYNLSVKSYSGMIFNIINMISILYAIYKDKKIINQIDNTIN